jgi:predicted ATPase/DNA-binding winged helix-turn-helix (wHTH) protein
MPHEELLAVMSRTEHGAGPGLDLRCNTVTLPGKKGAMTGPAPQTRDVISFGPFTLVASERVLTREGTRIELGGRTLDILVTLVSHPNEVVSKRDLLSRVWPDVVVEEGSLRFHVASLRKALGDGKGGARYITTVAGRGYCFVAPIMRSSDRSAGSAEPLAGFQQANLPGRLLRMVGRTADTRMISTQVAAARFVTIVGAGGVGKTTVAIAVGHDLLDAFAGAVLFVDLGMLGDPKLAPTALASMLGLSVQTDDVTPSLLGYLRHKRILLILDTCEHLIEAVAALAAAIFVAAPQVHILATSREALRVEGEHVYKLDPLACPPEDLTLTATVAHTFPATQLFVDRALACGAHLDLDDAEAAMVANICRKLDGVALAIELAAGRIEAFGLQQTAAMLDQRLTRLWPGRRTAPPRQKTLQATLDWSYGLLSELERVVLRRLAVFVGHFTIEAALAIVTSPTVDQGLVFGAIDSLVAKSMVAARPIGAMMRYRLLDTTRAYALEIGIDNTELADLAARHAVYYRHWLEQTGTDWPTLSTGAERVPHFAGLNNARAALEWAFGTNGATAIGVGLAAAAAPVFLAMSLLTECHRWSERALLALDAAARGGLEEMHLQAGFGMSLMFTRAHSDVARAAFERSLAIAVERRDVHDQLLLLGPLHMFHLRTGNFRAALNYAERCATIAATIQDPFAVTLSHSLLGISLHLMGNLRAARAQLEEAVSFAPDYRPTSMIYAGFDPHHWSGIALARTLWLQGHPDQAVTRARQTIKNAQHLGHPVTLAIVLNWAVSVFLWTGDLASAEEHLHWFVAHAKSHSMGPYVAVGRGHEGELALHRGHATSAVECLQSCLRQLHEVHYELLNTEFNISLAQGLVAIGRLTEGLALIEETIRSAEADADTCFVPELLRVKGSALLSMPSPDPQAAEMCLMLSLELSRRQGARALELRAAIDLAALLARQGRAGSARALLEPLFGQFVEGTDTADLQAAARLLASLG